MMLTKLISARRTLYLGLVAGLLGAGLMGGCPTPPASNNNTNDNGGDPTPPPPPPTLAIDVSESNLRDTQTATLEALFTNISSSNARVEWRIETVDEDDDPTLFFGACADRQLDATGLSVTLIGCSGTEEVTHVVTATARIGDVTLSAQVFVRVRAQVDIDFDSTALTANPTASPTFVPLLEDGESEEVVLNARVSGQDGAVRHEWRALATLPANVTIDDAVVGEEIVGTAAELRLTVDGPAFGVFPFSVTVEDAAGAVATGIVSVHLGVSTSLMIDAAAVDEFVGRNRQIEINTKRAFGLEDIRYTFVVLNEAGDDRTSAVNFSRNSVTFDATDGNDANGAENTWTLSGLDAAGHYRICVTATDARGESFTAIAPVLVGDGLGLALSAAQSRVGANEDFNLILRRNGGTADFRYTFQVYDSDGSEVTDAAAFNPDSNTEDNSTTIVWGHSGISAAGTYTIVATVRDGDGQAAAASTQISVGDVLTLDATSSQNILAPGETATLTFNVTGGTGSYRYDFEVDAPSGAPAPALSRTSPSSASGDLTLTFTAPAADDDVQGTYLVRVTVTDSLTLHASASVWIAVLPDDGLTLDARAGDNEVAPGTLVSLNFDVNGGNGNYAYEFSATGGAFEPAVATSNDTGDETDISWRAPSNSTAPGSYRIDVRVTDALGNVAQDSVWILVVVDALTLDARASDYSVAPGATVDLTFDKTGGWGVAGADFNYTYTASGGTLSDPSPTPGAAGSGDLTTVDWTAPAGATGSFQINVTVTDDRNDTATDTIWIDVVADALTLDARASSYVVSPGATIDLTFDRTGGVGPAGTDFEYTYSASGGTFSDPSPTDGAAGTGDLTTVDWTAPAGATGSFQIQVTVEDGEGRTATDTIWVDVVVPTLTLDVRSSEYVVNPGDTVDLTFDRTGGLAPADTDLTYTYTASGGTLSDPSPSPGEAPDGDLLSVDWTAPATPGGYAITGTVTDLDGNTATDTVWITVSASPLDVIVSSNAIVLAPGIPALIDIETFNGSGGATDYDYAFTDTNSFGGAAGGDFEPNAIMDSASSEQIVYVPDLDSSGTINIRADVNDANATTQEILPLYVTRDRTLVAGDIFIDPPAPENDIELFLGLGDVLPSQDLTVADPLMIPAASLVNSGELVDARNLHFLFLDGGAAGLEIDSVTITGTNARGQGIQEVITSPATNTLIEGQFPFKTISQVTIDIDDANVADAGDLMFIGVGERFGLSGRLPTTMARATAAFQIIAIGTGFTAGSAAGITPGSFEDTTALTEIHFTDDEIAPITDQQYIRFTDVPNGTRDYIIQIACDPSYPTP